MKQDTKTDVLQIRVTPAQKEQFKLLASAAGLSMTGFILAECLGEKIGQMILDGFDQRYQKNE